MHSYSYFAAPGASITAMPNANWTAGQSITLTCSVDDTSGFQDNPTYQWTKNNGSGSGQMIIGTNSSTFTFHLSLSNAANYTCRVNSISQIGQIRIGIQGYYDDDIMPELYIIKSIQ
jgi:hypothetical protein